MCKYCEFTYVSDLEKTNECKSIAFIRDGSHVFEVMMNRYRDTKCSSNELIFEECVNLDDGLHTVKDKHIKIKYCPFCGEKL